MGVKYDNLMDEVDDLLYDIERHLANIDPAYYTKEMIADRIRDFNRKHSRITNVFIDSGTIDSGDM